MDFLFQSHGFQPVTMPAAIHRQRKHAAGRRQPPPSFVSPPQATYHRGPWSPFSAWERPVSMSQTSRATPLPSHTYQLESAYSTNFNLPQAPEATLLEADTLELAFNDTLRPDPRYMIDLTNDIEEMKRARPQKSMDEETRPGRTLAPYPPHATGAFRHTGNTELSPSSQSASTSSYLPPLTGGSDSTAGRLDIDACDARSCSGDAEDTGLADQPYSQLIERALRSSTGNKLSLQEIYRWFERNTSKRRDQGSKGWQNSIRHNLSMNAGFVRDDSLPGKKTGNVWKLTDEALRNGIQSTTKYRKQSNHRKSISSECPASQRLRAGPKSGKATRLPWSKSRRAAEVDEQRIKRGGGGGGRRQQPPFHFETPEEDGLQQEQPSLTTPAPAHVCRHPTTTTTSQSTELSFDMRHIIGCTDDYPPWDTMFYDNPDSDSVLRPADQGYLALCGCLPHPNSPWLFSTDSSADLSLGAS